MCSDTIHWFLLFPLLFKLAPFAVFGWVKFLMYVCDGTRRIKIGCCLLFDWCYKYELALKVHHLSPLYRRLLRTGHFVFTKGRK